MGYLDNSSITVDAILTKKGRELLAAGNFNITNFALADDEIDYSLFNINHPDGSQFSGQAIENMPILEAFPDETNMMRHKLVTLNRGSNKIPIISGISNLEKNRNDNIIITPSTSYLNGSTGVQSEAEYKITVTDRRLFTVLEGGAGNVIATQIYSDGTAVSATARGTSFTLKTLNSTSLFGTNSQLVTIVTIEGMDTGARRSISITINKEATNNSDTSGGEVAGASTSGTY